MTGYPFAFTTTATLQKRLAEIEAEIVRLEGEGERLRGELERRVGAGFVERLSVGGVAGVNGDRTNGKVEG